MALKSSLDGLARIVREEGVVSLWKGWGPNFNRAMFMTASQVATYDQFKQMLLASGFVYFSFLFEMMFISFFHSSKI